MKLWLTALLLIVCGGCAATPPAPGEVEHADHGAAPEHYQDAIAAYFQSTLKDPSSVQYGAVTPPTKGYFTTKLGLIYGGGTKRTYGWLVNATINAKNSYGGYVGFRTYQFLFHGELIVDSISPSTD